MNAPSIRRAAALAFVLALALAGCSTPYGADKGYGGYSDTPIEKNLFRVAFTATPGMGGQQVHDLALLRAAQIAQKHGFAYFSIVRENKGITTRIQLQPAQGYITEYSMPTWVSTPRGPVMVMQSYPDWQWVGDSTANVPVPYSELFFRGLHDRAAAPAGEMVYTVAQVIPEMVTRYKIKLK